MSFSYEQSIWGKGKASLQWSSPTSFRLRQACEAIASLKAGAKVLEIGCGAGQFIRAIQKIHPEFECYGVDISRQAIEFAKTNNDGVTYALNEPYQFSYEDATFDAVLIFDVLEHVADPGKLLTEVRRVLKNNGILYAFVPCEGDWLSLWQMLDTVHLKRDLTQKYAGHIQFFSRKQLQNLFIQKKFEISKLRYSEHLLGQFLGVVVFSLMDRAAHQQGIKQLNNETYFEKQSPRRFVKVIKNIVNSLVYLESTLFSRLPSPNVHLVARKSAST